MATILEEPRMIAERGRTVDVAGIETFYLEEGAGDLTFLLIHGGGAGADAWGNWRDVIPLLSPRYRVLAYDMLGWGRTAKPDVEYSHQRRSHHLAAFLAAVAPEGAVLVGNSMGGATAIEATQEVPELVRGLVLMGSAGRAREIPPSIAPVLHYDGTREGMVRIIEALTHDDYVPDEALIDYRHALSVEPDVARAFAASMAFTRQSNGFYYEREYLSRISCPTLVVNGKQDKVTTVANAYDFIEMIPNASGLIIDNCGHWAMIEHPAMFAQALDFFATNMVLDR